MELQIQNPPQLVGTLQTAMGTANTNLEDITVDVEAYKVDQSQTLGTLDGRQQGQTQVVQSLTNHVVREVNELNTQLLTLRGTQLGKGKGRGGGMCGLKSFERESYSGASKDVFKHWAKRIRTFGENRTKGMKVFMEWAEQTGNRRDQERLGRTGRRHDES